MSIKSVVASKKGVITISLAAGVLVLAASYIMALLTTIDDVAVVPESNSVAIRHVSHEERFGLPIGENRK